MDSCHLFNFLFGTKKATTELSKCFSSVVSSSSSSSSSSGNSSSSSKKSKNNNVNRTSKQNIGQQQQQQQQQQQTYNCRADANKASELPLSPLKQLQMKIVSLAPNSAKTKTVEKRDSSVNCDAECGTYRATLVELGGEEDQHHHLMTKIGENEGVVHNNVDEDSLCEHYVSSKSVHQEEVRIVENPLNIDKNLNGNGSIGDGNEKEIEKNNLDENLELFDETMAIQSTVVSATKDGAKDMSIKTQNNKPTTINKQQQVKCRRVILYDDCELKQQQQLLLLLQTTQDQQQQGHHLKSTIEPIKRQIVASAEVYNMVAGDNKEKRAELRKVSSFVTSTDSNNNNYEEELQEGDNNNNNNKVDNEQQDKKRRESLYQNKVVVKSQQQQQQPLSSTFNEQQSSDDYDDINSLGRSSSGKEKSCESLRDKRSVYVQSLVQSIELTGRFNAAIGEEDSSKVIAKSPPPDIKSHTQLANNYLAKSIEINSKQREELPNRDIPLKATSTTISNASSYTNKPVTFVKPLPPKTPPKTNKARCLNMQISLNKPIKIQHLFQDEKFLIKFFDKLEPLDRCVAAQVCRSWRNILYSNQKYWKDLINVIDCTQLRRDYLVECIINTLQSAKSKQQKAAIEATTLTTTKDQHNGQVFSTIKSRQDQVRQFDVSSQISSNRRVGFHFDNCRDQLFNNNNNNNIQRFLTDSYIDFDQDDVWRIQELCNRYTQRIGNATRLHHQQLLDTSINGNQSNNDQINQQQQQQTCSASKSSSIPSQISSTLSSVSLSSLLSPLSESSRIESIKERLYNSLDNRGFDAICLFGATDDDIDDLVNKMPLNAHKRIICCRLNNCSISNRSLDLLISTFTKIEEIELSGCNEITNCFDLKSLTNLKRLLITDCINIADGVAQKLIQIIHQLDELTIQAYHLTDTFIEYISLNSDTTRLKRLDLPNCKEITNQSIVTIAKYFPNLESLSISGSTKITDDGIEVLAEQARKLKSLDLSWCSRITDASLECIACDLGDTLTGLILDRNVHITDIGLGYLATMSKLTLLHIRWCPQITDIGLESIISQVKTLKYLSLAGVHQITARSLLYLVGVELLEEVELTNCPSVNRDLLLFLSTRLPKCNIIF